MLAAVQAAGCSPRHPRRAPIARGAPTARSVLGTRQSRVLTGAGCSGRHGVTAIGSRGSAPLRSPSLRSPPPLGSAPPPRRPAPPRLPAQPRPLGSLSWAAAAPRPPRRSGAHGSPRGAGQGCSCCPAPPLPPDGSAGSAGRGQGGTSGSGSEKRVLEITAEEVQRKSTSKLQTWISVADGGHRCPYISPQGRFPQAVPVPEEPGPDRCPRAGVRTAEPRLWSCRQPRSCTS